MKNCEDCEVRNFCWYVASFIFSEILLIITCKAAFLNEEKSLSNLTVFATIFIFSFINFRNLWIRIKILGWIA